MKRDVAAVLRLVLMGVSGVGKTTVGQLVAQAADIPFIDADDFHPPANKAKMAAGEPLNDEDRWPWLKQINRDLRSRPETAGFVLACSALKASYRKVLKRGVAPPLLFVFLNAPEAVIQARLDARRHEFMPADLLRSQFEALERPTSAIELDAADSPEVLAVRVLAAVAAT